MDRDPRLVADKYMSPDAKAQSNNIRADYGLPQYSGASAGGYQMQLPDYQSAVPSAQVEEEFDPFEDMIRKDIEQVTTTQIDSSFFKSVEKGWEESESWMGDATSWAASQMGPTAAEVMTSRLSAYRYLSSDTLIKVLETMTGDTKKREAFQQMSPQQRRDYIKREKQDIFNQMHGEVMGNKFGEGVGSFGREVIADPTTYVGGTGLKAMVALGATSGTLNAVFEGLAEEGKVDAGDVANGFIFGAAGGLGAHIIAKAGEAGVNWIREFSDSGRKVTKADLDKLADETGMPLLLEHLPENSGANAQGVYRYTQQELDDLNALISRTTDKPRVRIIEESKPKAQVVKESKPIIRVTEGTKPKMRETSPSKPIVRATEEKPTLRVTEEAKPIVQVRTGHDGVTRVRITGYTKPKVQVTKTGGTKYEVVGHTKPKYRVTPGEKPTVRIIGHTKPVIRITGATKPRIRVSYPEVDPNLVAKIDNPMELDKITVRGQAAKDYVDAVVSKNPQAIQEAAETLDVLTSKAPSPEPSARVALEGSVSRSEPLAEESSTNLRVRVDASTAASEAVEETIVDATGRVTPQAKEAMGLSPDENISLAESMERIASGQIPADSALGGSNITFGKSIVFNDEAPRHALIARQLGNGVASDLFIKPEMKLKVLGTAGRRLAERLAVLRETIAQRMGKAAVAFNKVDVSSGRSKLSRTEKKAFDKSVRGVLNKTLDRRFVDDGVKEMADHVQQHLSRLLDESLHNRVINPDRYRALRQKAKDEGYFPRVVNFDYLNTKRGKEAFMSAITNHNFTESEVERLRNTMTGKKWREVKGITKQKDGTYSIDRTLAMDLLALQRGKMHDVKSNHMEKDRTLGLPDEVLDPFMIQDLAAAVTTYNRDVMSRIAQIKVMGKDGHLAARDILDIKKEAGGDEITGNFAKNLYDTAIGSADSSVIKRAAGMEEGWKKATSVVAAYQSLKLITASISNLTSATVLLPTKLAAEAPSLSSAMNAYSKAVGQAFTEEGWNVARGMGAIHDTLIVQMQGEMGSLEKKFTTRYLRGIGFTASEEFNRVVASLTGKAMIDDVFNQLDVLAEKATRPQGMSPRMIKQKEKLERTLKGYGLDPDRSKMTASDLERAAQRFSNEVNFVASADQLPMHIQNPYMRVFRQFQTYSLMYSSFVNKHVLEPFTQGNLLPAAVLMAAAGTAGSAVYGIKELANAGLDSVGYALGEGLTGNVPSEIEMDEVARDVYETWLDQSATERFIQGFQMVGALGWLGGVAEKAAEGSPERLALSLLGPGPADVLKISTGMASALIELDPELAIKPMVKSLPRGSSIAEGMYGQSGPAHVNKGFSTRGPDSLGRLNQYIDKEK